MPLLTLRNLDFSVGGPLLLEKVNLSIESGERICVVGRNGAGKSTLLRLLDGEIRPDDGEIQREPGLKVARLTQEITLAEDADVFDVVAAGLGDAGASIARYHHLAMDSSDPARQAELAEVQSQIEAGHGWDLDTRVSQILEKLKLPANTAFSTLSGGQQRRVLLGRALVAEPDLLLLDEPTNHLDIESIEALQTQLLGFRGALVFVTHDRSFLRALATRIVEIDRGQLSSWPGDYDNYLRRRAERDHAESLANAHFDKKLAQEEVWIRKGIEARRTRNEGRVRALKQMRRERAARRDKPGQVKISVSSGQSSGRRVIETRALNYQIDGRTLVRDLDLLIQRGDRIGFIGPNGSGKTTLLLLLLGELTPSSGEVEHGSGLQIAYFDQYRAQLDESLNAIENVAEGREYIEVGKRRVHVMGYLQDFLFTPERALAPITKLSGGERNRLLLAKQLTRPANLLVLDEPTNDLDVETLELLEDLLTEYQGTVLLVSHDREFLDNVVTSTVVLEGEGRVAEYVGGYADWLRQRPQPVQSSVAPSKPARAAAETPPPAAKKTKLSYKDARELEALPARIESLEMAIAELGEQMNEPSFYQQASEVIVAENARLSELQADLEAAYERWAALE
ncbi:MAG: ATP-binding cassette domain-containing protein [Xanthomonadales bacterium]|nr:ATP-binding cassette domain-containing protein [Xanthomonadales bacterium]